MSEQTLTVRVIAWNHREALGIVDGLRVRIDRTRRRVRWRCEVHGVGFNNPNHCEHTAALAATPTPPRRQHP